MFQALVKESAERRYSPYLFGAREQILQEMQKEFKQKQPNLNIAGTRNGYFDNEDLHKIVEEINNSEADILFIGILSPLKEEIRQKYVDDLQVPVVMGVGGSFDVVAWEISRAPVFFKSQA